jgi:amino acid transporter
MIRHVDEKESLSGALAADRLGVPGLLYFVMSASAPLTIVAGVLTTAYAVTGNLGLPSSFFILAVVLAIFAVGYVTMSRHIPHAGAFYAYVSQGLGGAAGVGASWVSILAYNLLQVALYGALGVGAAPLVKEYFGIDLPWWPYAFLMWAVVAVLGIFRVDINSGVLAILLTVEVVTIVVLDVAFLAHPAHGLDLSLLSPTELFKPGATAVLAVAMLGFTGFESAVVFTEEARHPRRSVPAATYSSIIIIAVLYGVSAWAMTVADGADKIVADSQKNGPGVLFGLAGQTTSPWVATLGQVLFVTSLAAAAIAFHNATARYTFALGREGVLPKVFGGTSGSGAPRAGSLAQTVVGFVTIVVFAVGGFDPLVWLFYTGGTAGALAILVLLFVSTIAVISFFARNRRGESLWRTLWAPVISIFGVGGVLVLVLANYATLLGVQESSPLRWGIPAAVLMVAVAGYLYGLSVKYRKPQVYAAIGLGAKSTDVQQPAQRHHHLLTGPVEQVDWPPVEQQDWSGR